MKITYTSEDGRNWETEAECLGWEKFNKLLFTPDCRHAKLNKFMSDLSEGMIYGLEGVWSNRSKFYGMVELMKAAEK